LFDSSETPKNMNMMPYMSNPLPLAPLQTQLRSPASGMMGMFHALCSASSEATGRTGISLPIGSELRRNFDEA
jgi:hypothetical protein